jgi:hypothetical protein
MPVTLSTCFDPQDSFKTYSGAGALQVHCESVLTSAGALPSSAHLGSQGEHGTSLAHLGSHGEQATPWLSSLLGSHGLSNTFLLAEAPRLAQRNITASMVARAANLIVASDTALNFNRRKLALAGYTDDWWYAYDTCDKWTLYRRELGFDKATDEDSTQRRFADFEGALDSSCF